MQFDSNAINVNQAKPLSVFAFNILYFIQVKFNHVCLCNAMSIVI